MSQPVHTIGAPPVRPEERASLIAELLADPEVLSAAIARQAETGARRHEVEQGVEAYAQEIVPHFSETLYYRLAYRLARALATALFRVRVGFIDEDNLRRIQPDATVVFVMNHRSNMDYVLVAFLVSEHVAISYAVGEWARVWPLDALLRAMGAYFVRRNSRDALYRKVLERYVQLATARGVTQGIFPEGGLSRDGHLRAPRVGLFYYMLKGYRRESARDVIFVPVGVNYDRVLEDKTLLLDLEPEPAPRPTKWGAMWITMRWVAKNMALYARGRLHRFGYACVNFGTPFSLANYLEERQIDLGATSDADCFAEAETLAGALMHEVAQVVPVTPVGLVATALASFGGHPATRALLHARVRALVEELDTTGAHVYVPRGHLEYLIDVGLRMLAIRRIVRHERGAFQAVGGQERLLQYYVNSIAHFFERRESSAAAPSDVRNATTPRRSRRAVVLVHGLARTSRSMARMARALEEDGYEVYNWDYPSRQYGIDALVDALAAYVADIAPQVERLDFVTHSMGGLLVRGVLTRHQVPIVGRLVMLAPPNRGADIATRFRHYAWARGFYGQAIDDLSPAAGGPVSSLGVPSCRFGVVAGTRSFHPLIPTSYYSSLVRESGTHDGTVQVAETELAGMADFVTVPANHTFIMDHPDAIHQTLHFLREGGFDKGTR